jgi:asparagine synthase (glutamine-hydrolysing)
VLAQANRRPGIADVPVARVPAAESTARRWGAYQKYSSSKVRTFTIGYAEPASRAEYAKQVATHFDTEHSERYVTGASAGGVIPPSMYDEPFADSSQSRRTWSALRPRAGGRWPLWCGAGRMFGGTTDMSARRAVGAMKRTPAPLRAAAGCSLGGMPPAA